MIAPDCDPYSLLSFSNFCKIGRRYASVFPELSTSLINTFLCFCMSSRVFILFRCVLFVALFSVATIRFCPVSSPDKGLIYTGMNKIVSSID